MNILIIFLRLYFLGAKTSTPVEGANANICPLGHFCPLGTAEPNKCPIGTLGLATRQTMEAQCTLCPAGKYCDSPGRYNDSGSCSQGYYCPNGSKSAQEVGCPPGRYCPVGSPTPKLCPRGTFSNTTLLWKEEQCTNCTAGFYCMENGLTDPSGPCRQGYYCPSASKVDNAVDCPVGLHCPTGMCLIIIIIKIIITIIITNVYTG